MGDSNDSEKRCQKLQPDNVTALMSSLDAVFFDCDGTLWRGDDVLAGAVSLVNRLLLLGKRVGYVTNNSCRTQSEMIEELKHRGFPVPEDGLVMCTAHATAIHLAKRIPGGTAFLVAPPALSFELSQVGIRSWSIHGEDIAFPSEPAADAVICALDRTFSYKRLSVATHLLLTNKKCLFVATNLDATFPESGGRLFPDCGPIVAALSAATGKTPDVVVGKPSPLMLEQICDHLSLDPKRVLMVGDRCETDMAFASAINAKSLLVLTGVSDVEEAKSHLTGGPSTFPKAPFFIAESVAEFNDLIAKNL